MTAPADPAAMSRRGPSESILSSGPAHVAIAVEEPVAFGTRRADSNDACDTDENRAEGYGFEHLNADARGGRE